ncbi:MAG: hypothetical protein ACI9U2_000785 [Bradymonadia bacterium]|jgi:hypothetical protein
MRSLMLAAIAMTLAGCTAASTETGKCVRIEPQQPPAPKAQMVASGMPTQGGYRMLIAVDAQTPPESFYGLYYGAVAMGWRVTVAGPADGPLPAQTTVSAAKPAEHDVLVLPSTVAVEGLVPFFAHAAIVGRASHLIDPVGTGLSPSDPPRPTTRLVVQTPGEIPALLHQLQTLAEDRLRVRHRATGGHPP